MTINKRKKNSRQRGSHTHGWGAMKKHRGAGNRGGRGLAGTGKKGDVKKPSIWKDTKYFGRYGFKKKGAAEKINPINLSYFEEKAEKLLADKMIQKEGDSYVIDASKLGYNKILGCVKLTKKLKITAKSFSKQAVEKIKDAGGEAVELKKMEKAKPKEEVKAKPEQTKEG
jgi:large subunit ribosomal protein L15